MIAGECERIGYGGFNIMIGLYLSCPLKLEFPKKKLIATVIVIFTCIVLLPCVGLDLKQHGLPKESQKNFLSVTCNNGIYDRKCQLPNKTYSYTDARIFI